MWSLAAATALVAVGHIVPSVPGVRGALMARLGRGPYLALHSLVSLVAVSALVVAWGWTDPAPSPLDLGPGVKGVAVLAMPAAFILIAARLLRKPTGTAAGIYGVTAVPGSLGVLIWTLLHLAAVSDARATVIFTGFAAIALFSLVKNLMTAPPELRRIGWIPFAAALRGRVRMDWRGIGIAPVLWGLGAWVALLLLHPLVFGPDPLVWVLG